MRGYLRLFVVMLLISLIGCGTPYTYIHGKSPRVKSTEDILFMNYQLVGDVHESWRRHGLFVINTELEKSQLFETVYVRRDAPRTGYVLDITLYLRFTKRSSDLKAILLGVLLPVVSWPFLEHK